MTMCWWVLLKQINSRFCHVSKCCHLFVELNPRPWASGSTPVQQRWVGDKVGGSSPAVLPSTIHHVDWMVNVVLWFVTHWSETGRIHITDVILQKLLSRLGNWGLGRKLGGWSAIRSEWTAADSSLVDVNHVVVPLCRGLGNILKQPILDAYMWLDAPTNSAVGCMHSIALLISQRVLNSMNDATEEFMMRQGMAFATLWQRSVWHNMSRQASETCATWAALALVEAHVLYIVHVL